LDYQLLLAQKVNFFISNLQTKILNNDVLVSKILSLIVKHKANINKDFSVLVNNGPGSFSSLRASLAVAKGIKITITGNLFKSTSAEIDPKYYDVVHQIGQLIADSDLMNINSKDEHKSLLKIIDQNNATLNVEVRCEGHTDDAKLPPNAEYPSNWELSAARSLNLVRLMNKHAGMPEKYFSALGYGEFRPVIDVSNISDFKEKQKGRAKNRRVEIYLDAFLKNKSYTEKEINI